MVAYRERRLPIVPFAAVLGGALGSQALDPASRILVIRYGRDMIGLLVDAAQGIESFAPRDVRIDDHSEL
jgi:chemotaxis signal transduction protein